MRGAGGRRNMALDEKAVEVLRHEFPALQETHRGRPLIFFDGPGGTQVHGSVIEAMGRYFKESNSNAHGAFLHSRRTDETTSRARTAAMEFLGASRPEEIVFGPNMTTLAFRISQAIGERLSSGDEVVVTRLDHDANISPWTALQRKGVAVRWVDFDPARCTLDMSGMARCITERTRLVAVGYASNALGTINDVKAVVELARSVGARTFVDAVHYAPHGPIDVASLECDFLVCSAYKFFGPHMGILYGRHDLLAELPALKVVPAGNGPPDKFETGTNNFEGMSGANAAIDYLASVGRRFGCDRPDPRPDASDRRRDLLAGMAAIRNYEKALCAGLLQGLREIDGLRLYGLVNPDDLDRRVPTVSITSDRFSPAEIAARLDNENIFVWDGHFYAVSAIERLGLLNRGGLLRIGLCHYNTTQEVETLLDALRRMHR